jgi:two-component system chemotaxis response regulator CheY
MKALVVDDDIVSRMALIDLLSVYGVFDLVEAEDGEAAWTLLEAGLRPVICFCDVRMPRMSGIDLLQKMKGRPDLASLPFVLVSSASDRDTVLQAVTLGAVGYILKPLHAADARAHLEKIFKVTLDKLAEDPVATAQRLNIGTERLHTYLHAFGAQLQAGRTQLRNLLEAGNARDAMLSVDAFHTGCLTLGLWQAASMLDAARRPVADYARLENALGEVADAVRRQSSRMHASSAMLGSGAPV